MTYASSILAMAWILLSNVCIAGSKQPERKRPEDISALSDNYKPVDSTVLAMDPNTKASISLPAFSQRPNVVIILADDLDAVYTPPYFPDVLPAIDSLEKYGLVFRNSFTPMSICCPSRSATLTGSYAHTNGVYRNAGENGGWNGFRHNEPHTLPAQLYRAGYRTALIGKYLNGWGQPDAQPIYGWTDGSAIVSKDKNVYRGYDYELLNWSGGNETSDSTWLTGEKNRVKYGIAPEDYSTDVLSQKARLFIETSEIQDEQPFFLFLTPTAPHMPLPAPERYIQTSDQRWGNTFKSPLPNYFNDQGKLATSVEKKRPLDKASFLSNTWKKRVRQADNGKFLYNAWHFEKSPKFIKGFIQADWNGRMGSLLALNDMIRDVIETLKNNGEWDNTLLIFTSDNGYMLGAHAMIHKGNPYEASIRVPMLIAGGDSLRLRKPGTIDAWVTNLDLMPTILDLAGVPIPGNVEGLSLMPVLYNDSIFPLRDRFVMEYLGPGMSTDRLIRHPKLLYSILPSQALDIPSYNAIRMKVNTDANGLTQEKIYKYVEWQKYTSKKVLRFSDRYRIQDPALMQLIRSGDKKTLKLKEKAETVETELYDLQEDPYEMDNLLYYKPEAYRKIADNLKQSMRKIILKQ